MHGNSWQINEYLFLFILCFLPTLSHSPPGLIDKYSLITYWLVNRASYYVVIFLKKLLFRASSKLVEPVENLNPTPRENKEQNI